MKTKLITVAAVVALLLSLLALPVSAAPGSTDTIGYLYSADFAAHTQTYITSNDDGNGYPNFKITADLVKGQTYLLKVYGWNTTTGEFTLWATSWDMPYTLGAGGKLLEGDKITSAPAVGPPSITISTKFMTSKNTSEVGFGKQWWHFEKLSNGNYIIYNMGVRDLNNTDKMVLTATSSNAVNIADLTSTSNTAQQWILEYGAGSMYIKNASSGNYLYKSGDNLAMTTTAANKTAFGLTEQPIGVGWDGQIGSTTVGSVKYVKLIRDSGLGTLVTDAMLNDVAAAWGGSTGTISSKIRVYGPSTYSSIPSGVTVYEVTYKYVDSGSSIATTKQYNSLNVNIGNLSDSHHAIIEVYNNQFSLLSSTSKLKTLIHELGHALKMQHPLHYTPAWINTGLLSIMNQNPIEENTYVTVSLTWYDKQVLKGKWGE